MSADLKVVPFQQEGYKDAISALKNIVEQLESGELDACETGALVLISKGGAVDTFGFGPKSDDLQVIGAFRLGEQVIVDAAFPKGG
jgi:hypothetical protein